MAIWKSEEKATTHMWAKCQGGSCLSQRNRWISIVPIMLERPAAAC